MQVPITSDELDKLIKLSANGFDPKTIPLTHASGEHGTFAIESDTIGADAAWSLAQLAILRGEQGHTVRVGGPIVHTGARDVAVGDDRLAGYEKCEDCGSAEFMCANSPGHSDAQGGEGYSFPDYGARLNMREIQTLLQHSGLVTAYGAAQLAAYLDMEAYVLREVKPEGE